jgi:hypothetical protein
VQVGGKVFDGEGEGGGEQNELKEDLGVGRHGGFLEFGFNLI